MLWLWVDRVVHLLLILILILFCFGLVWSGLGAGAGANGLFTCYALFSTYPYYSLRHFFLLGTFWINWRKLSSLETFVAFDWMLVLRPENIMITGS